MRVNPNSVAFLLSLVLSASGNPIHVDETPYKASANPPGNGTKTRRGDDNPLNASPYPYGTAIKNEFKWLHWDPDNPEHRKDGEKIHKAFEEWIDLVKAAQVDAAKNKQGATFKRWFGNYRPQADIPNVFGLMIDEKGTVTKEVHSMVLDREDFIADEKLKCFGNPKKDKRAYTIPEDGHFHICPAGLAMRQNSEIKCEDLDASCSSKMRSLSMTILHEMTHFDDIGASGHSSIMIEDLASTAYDCFKLDDEGKADNAQNYAWYAGEAFFSEKCKKIFEDPKEDTKDIDDELPEENPPSASPVKCKNLKTEGETDTYFTRDTISTLINENYCPKWEGMSSEIGMAPFLLETPETVEISAVGGFQVEKTITVEECKKNLHRIIDECDNDASANPMNWKAGGQVEVDGWTYEIRPLHDRPIAPQKPSAWCKISGCHAARCSLSLWGAGWLNSGFGHELREAFEATHIGMQDEFPQDLTGYDTSKWGEAFQYELMDKHEWTVEKLPVYLGFAEWWNQATVDNMKKVANANDPNFLDVKCEVG